MIFPLIRCNYSDAFKNPNVFFVLCKGANAGKPSLNPWPNSFVVICSNQQYFDFYFWLIYALFQSGKFKIRLRGSVIPFINIDDVRDLLREVAPVIHDDWSRFRELIATLDKLSKLKSKLQEQVKASENLQLALLNNYFESAKLNAKRKQLT